MIMNKEEKILPDFLKNPKNPFRTPEGYFDSVESKVMDRIESQTKKKSPSINVIRILKPLLGLAASITIIYLLVSQPMQSFLFNKSATTNIADTTTDWVNNYSSSLSSIDENSLINTLFTDETTSLSGTNPDEFLAYLSTGMNEVEIYSEIQK
jgi:hypothetical protein